MGRATREPPANPSPVRGARIAVGDYLCSERNLYRVEQLVDGRFLIEDCRTGDLIDAPVHELSDLRRLDR